MSSPIEENMVAALDIGTSMVVEIVGTVGPGGE